jgi:hypothetical protein
MYINPYQGLFTSAAALQACRRVHTRLPEQDAGIGAVSCCKPFIVTPCLHARPVVLLPHSLHAPPQQDCGIAPITAGTEQCLQRALRPSPGAAASCHGSRGPPPQPPPQPPPLPRRLLARPQSHHHRGRSPAPPGPPARSNLHGSPDPGGRGYGGARAQERTALARAPGAARTGGRLSTARRPGGSTTRASQATSSAPAPPWPARARLRSHGAPQGTRSYDHGALPGPADGCGQRTGCQAQVPDRGSRQAALLGIRREAK